MFTFTGKMVKGFVDYALHMWGGISEVRKADNSHSVNTEKFWKLYTSLTLKANTDGVIRISMILGYSYRMQIHC